jgi:hypothetical protein
MTKNNIEVNVAETDSLTPKRSPVDFVMNIMTNYRSVLFPA